MRKRGSNGPGDKTTISRPFDSFVRAKDDTFPVIPTMLRYNALQPHEFVVALWNETPGPDPRDLQSPTHIWTIGRNLLKEVIVQPTGTVAGIRGGDVLLSRQPDPRTDANGKPLTRGASHIMLQLMPNTARQASIFMPYNETQKFLQETYALVSEARARQISTAVIDQALRDLGSE